MTIEQSTLNDTTNLKIVPEVTINTLDQTIPDTWEKRRINYKFRYTVHRQHVGFFTPMVYDVEFVLSSLPSDVRKALGCLDKIVEPFVEGSLFVNHESSMLVEFLKGQNFNINRKTLVESIRKTVTTPVDDEYTPVWYSDWITPPPTIQSQRIFVYDMDSPHHGSMLDPRNALRFILEWFYNNVTVPAKLHEVSITAGYTNKVTQHARD